MDYILESIEIVAAFSSCKGVLPLLHFNSALSKTEIFASIIQTIIATNATFIKKILKLCYRRARRSRVLLCSLRMRMRSDPYNKYEQITTFYLLSVLEYRLSFNFSEETIN